MHALQHVTIATTNGHTYRQGGLLRSVTYGAPGLIGRVKQSWGLIPHEAVWPGRGS